MRGRRILLTGGNHPIVTTLAGAFGFIVINRGRWYPGRVDMAGFAQITGENMRGALARGAHRIVTGKTGLGRQ